MPKELPGHPNIDHLKSQAKDLLDAYQRGDAPAFARFREGLPSARGKTDAELATMKLALHDAQSVVAREYGFDSFADLRAHVATTTEDRKPIQALMSAHPNAPLPPQVIEALMAASAKVDKPRAITGAVSLPLVPLRGALITVGSVVPIHVARPSTLAAVKVAREGSGLLAVFSQKDAANEAPSMPDLHPVGCAVQLVSTLALESYGTFLVLRGAQWVRLEAVEQTEPHLVVRVSPFEIAESDAEDVSRAEGALRARLRTMAEALPGGDRIRAMLDGMSALELADAAVANLPCSIDDKARYASEQTVIARLERALSLAGG
jgi:Lon protease-like protein